MSWLLSPVLGSMCLLFGLVRLTDLTEFVRGIVVHGKDFAVWEWRTWVLEDPTGTPVQVARVFSRLCRKWHLPHSLVSRSTQPLLM